LNEILTLREIASSPTPQTSSSSPPSTPIHDYTIGIYQSIGYKEFHDYLTSPDRSEKSFDAAVRNMKNSTRKYAKRQVSWLRNKLLPTIYAANATGGTQLAPTYLLDATELGDNWDTCVRDLGQHITEDFLSNRTLPDPMSLSYSARKMLTINNKPTDPTEILNVHQRITCPICTIDIQQPIMIQSGQEWILHQKSRTHRKFVNRAIRLESGQQLKNNLNIKEEFEIEGQCLEQEEDKVDWQEGNFDESITSLFPS